MEHTQTINCPHCSSSNLHKGGLSKNGTQRWHCKGCKKYFQLTYRYKAREPGVKEKIDDLILNSSGVRDTARVLGINKNTVILHLKKNTSIEPLPD